MKANTLTKETILNLGVFERHFPNFKAGDTIVVTTNIKEGEKVRQQQFEGTVISMKGTGITKTFCLRKIIDGIAIERIFPYYSKNIVSVGLKTQGDVRRAKLYYLRGRYGKKGEVKLKKKTRFSDRAVQKSAPAGANAQI
jgi:large subunit ribosomal protein L19